jgi:hypothetical protein
MMLDSIVAAQRWSRRRIVHRRHLSDVYEFLIPDDRVILTPAQGEQTPCARVNEFTHVTIEITTSKLARKITLALPVEDDDVRKICGSKSFVADGLDDTDVTLDAM